MNMALGWSIHVHVVVILCVVAVSWAQNEPPGSPSLEQCDTGWWNKGGQCYFYSQTAATWTQARAECLSLGGNLAGVRDKATQKLLSASVRDVGVDHWLGLYYSTSKSWMWTDTGQNLASYKNWTPKSRVGGLKRGRCVVMQGRGRDSRDKAGMWRRANCVSKMRFVCQKAAVVVKDSCPEGWHLYGSTCYLGYLVPMTWVSARQTCIRFGGDLATLDSYLDQRYINSMMVERMENYWSGLHFDWKEDKWLWVANQQEPKYTNWAPTLPDSTRIDQGERCVFLIGQYTQWTRISDPINLGMWVHDICERKMSFVCQKASDKIPVVKTIASHGADILDVTVGDDIHTILPLAIDHPIQSTPAPGLLEHNPGFAMANVPLSLVVIAILVTGGVVLALCLVKRGICRFQDDSVQQNQKSLNSDKELSIGVDEGEYATISEIMDQMSKHEAKTSKKSVVDLDKHLKDKHDAVVVELKHQNSFTSLKDGVRPVHLRVRTTSGCSSRPHSYLDLNGQWIEKAEYINQSRSEKGFEDVSKEFSIGQRAKEDLPSKTHMPESSTPKNIEGSISMTYEDIVDKDSITRNENDSEYRNWNTVRGFSGNGDVVTKSVPEVVIGDGYEIPIKTTDLYSNLQEGDARIQKAVECPTEEELDSEWEEDEDYYIEYEQPVR